MAAAQFPARRTIMRRSFGNFPRVISMLLVAFLSGQAQALPAPSATTGSELRVNGSLRGVLLRPSSSVESEAISITDTVTSAIDTVDTISEFFAAADGNANIEVDPGLRSGGYLVDLTPIFEVGMRQGTVAESLRNGPLAAEASVLSRAVLNGVVVLPTSPDAALELTWDIDRLEARTNASASLALMQHLITVVQSPLGNAVGQSSIQSVGFGSISVGGNTEWVVFDRPGSSVIDDWLETTLVQGDSGPLVAGDNRLRIELPIGIPDAVDSTKPKPVEIAVEVSHLEHTTVAPLTAAPRFGEQAVSLFGGGMAHWNADTQTLSFDPLPLDLLTDADGESVLDLDDHDSLAGGYLEIDPFVFRGDLLTEGYFVGTGKMRLVTDDGRVLFQALAPGLVYDEELYDRNSFNLYAPLLGSELVQGGVSVWLDAFERRLRSEKNYLPELFIGIDCLVGSESDPSWASSDFDVRPQVVDLSFAGPLESQASESPYPSTRRSLWPSVYPTVYCPGWIYNSSVTTGMGRDPEGEWGHHRCWHQGSARRDNLAFRMHRFGRRHTKKPYLNPTRSRPNKCSSIHSPGFRSKQPYRHHKHHRHYDRQQWMNSF